MVAPTTSPRKMVTILISGPPAVLLNRSVTIDSLNRFPNINIPSSGALAGIINAVTTVVTMGKRITAVFDTGFTWGMSMERSLSEVRRRMMGG